MVSNICKLLSLAAGTVIEWIVADSDADLNGSVRGVHAARVTKPFCSFPMVPIKDFSYEANSQILQEFLQGVLEESSKYDPEVIKAFIATYLDARLETDYMQARGIKLVVALEMMKNMSLDDCIRDEYQKLLPDHVQREIAKIIGKALKENLIKKDVRQIVCSNLKGLERPSFGRVIKFMVRRLSLSRENSNIRTVIEVRNNLVHTGQFLSEEERQKFKEELPDAVSRFFALLSFTDRLVLRLLSYSGLYLNYSESTTAHIRSATQNISITP